jgi:phosphoribosyl-dephospho-CoA transferase
MSDDEAVTPKQSGSYGIMLDVCRMTIRQLEQLNLPNGDGQEACVQLLMRARRLVREINAWPESHPMGELARAEFDAEKSQTVSDVLRLREDAVALATAHGVALG